MTAQHAYTQVEKLMLNPKPRILLIEDETLFARAVQKKLQQTGYQVEHVETISESLSLVKQFQPEIVLLDMRLPDGNGLDLLADLVDKNIIVLVMTAFGEVADAVNAMKLGATDYLKKPIDLEELIVVIEKAENTQKLKLKIEHSRQRESHIEAPLMLGNSRLMKAVKSQIERIASLVANDAIPPTVLITGETGSGKDVAARLLHQMSANFDKPFVHVDCASLPPDLIESELFGHEKGAFTSAHSAKIGLIEAAEDGTLMLDEIGELPLGLQAKLLSVLERRVVRRIGSNKERVVQARFISATNRDLPQMVAEGRFRSDLYYRMNVMSVKMPALRERDGDILQLAEFFMAQTERRYALPKCQLSMEAKMVLKTYAWPGNVRELRHQINRAVLLCHHQVVSAADIALTLSAGTFNAGLLNARPASTFQGHDAISDDAKIESLTQLPSNRFSDGHLVNNDVWDGLNANAYTLNTSISHDNSLLNVTQSLDEAEKHLILQALQISEYNVSLAARKLNITRMAMRYRMNRHGIIVG